MRISTRRRFYAPARHTFTEEQIGTRYVLAGVRTLVDPADPADLKKVHALQDAIKVEQPAAGQVRVPNWDPVSQKKVRDALIVLATTLTDTSRSFGTKDEVDPIRTDSAAATWGGNPRKDAIYLNFTPPKNDGKTVYRLDVKDVPVDGFWSVSLYNAEGYFQKNDLNAYSLNNITSKKNADGSVDIQFGGCDGRSRTACRSCRAGTTRSGSIAREQKSSMAHGSFLSRSPLDKDLLSALSQVGGSPTLRCRLPQWVRSGH